MKKRLHKILAAAGIASLRKAEQLIAEGRVQVNGETASVGDFADPETDDIVADGNQVSAEQKRYLLLNKPTGFVTTVSDPHGRPTVMDLIDVRERVYPIGRLDTDTEGLLLLTNDGNFSQRMAHPRFEIEKTYRAELGKPLSTEGEMLLTRGIRLEDGPTAPARLHVLSKRRRRVDITIHEGRNRIVRRMFESVGSHVIKLRRTRFGSLGLDDVPKGKWRDLKGNEVDALLKSAADSVRPKKRQRSGPSEAGPRTGARRPMTGGRSLATRERDTGDQSRASATRPGRPMTRSGRPMTRSGRPMTRPGRPMTRSGRQ